MAIDPFFGSVLGAGSNILGGLVGAANANVINERAADQAANQMAAQKEYAQHGITWRARDIMSAYSESGIHPLALLGVQGPTYSPVSTAFTPSPLGESIGRAGQDISRGLNASADRELRSAALELQRDALNISRERGVLENELLKTRIASEQSRLFQQSSPAVPTPGISHPGVEKAVIDDVTVARTPRGGYVVLPSKAAQERMEEIFGLGPEWFARNRAWLATPEARAWVKRFLPAAPYSTEWRYNVPTGEWLPSYIEHEDRHMFTDIERQRGAQRWIDHFNPSLW